MKLLNTIGNKKEKNPGSPQRSNSSTSDSLPRSVEFTPHDDNDVPKADRCWAGGGGGATSSAAEIAARSATAQAASVKRSRAQRHQSLDITTIFGAGREGDATAAAIYANSFSKDPEFYEFTRSLRAYAATFNNKSDILLIDPKSDFFKYLNKSNGTKP